MDIKFLVTLLLIFVLYKEASTREIRRRGRQPGNTGDKLGLIKRLANTPCSKKNYTMPDFSAPNRRISEKKCAEYRWEHSVLLEKRQRKNECNEYKKGLNLEGIIGGVDAKPREFPHMGALGWRTIDSWTFLCGCSLISERFALTAAHCRQAKTDTNIVENRPKIVRFGDIDINNVPKANRSLQHKDFNIRKVIVYPKFAAPKSYFDIALIELEGEVKITLRIAPACLWTRSDKNLLGSKALITGWGMTEKREERENKMLKVAEIEMLQSKTCDDLLNLCSRNICGLKEHQICAGNLKGGVDACNRDSGGPLQVKSKDEGREVVSIIVGITSLGRNCGQPNSPGIYTRVSRFVDWIEDIVWPDGGEVKIQGDGRPEIY